MVRFPVRIGLPEVTYNVILYTAISLICALLAVQVLRRFAARAYILAAALLLCILLAGWQIVDLLIVRIPGPAVFGFGPTMSEDFSSHDGMGWYMLRFPNKEIFCNSLYEQYWGNHVIAITVIIDRDATWFACSG